MGTGAAVTSPRRVRLPPPRRIVKVEFDRITTQDAVTYECGHTEMLVHGPWMRKEYDTEFWRCFACERAARAEVK